MPRSDITKPLAGQRDFLPRCEEMNDLRCRPILLSKSQEILKILL
jgi:hypothetical protein